MLNVVSLLPHAKKDNKVESKASKGATLNELVELKSCSSCLFFEVSVANYELGYCSSVYIEIDWGLVDALHLDGELILLSTFSCHHLRILLLTSSAGNIRTSICGWRNAPMVHL